MHDLVIRSGLVVDGTGDAPRAADVAIDNGRITKVGVVDKIADWRSSFESFTPITTAKSLGIRC